QEVTTSGGLQLRALCFAELERPLELERLARPLGAEEMNRGVGGNDQPRLATEQVARVLGGEDQGAVVLADPPRQADDEAPDGRIVEEQSQLVDDQEAPAAAGLDPAPERFREQEMDGRHQLFAQLAHAEDDHRGLEVDVGGRAEHGAQAALDPASENLLQAAAWRQSLRDIFEQRLVDVGVSVPERGL